MEKRPEIPKTKTVEKLDEPIIACDLNCSQKKFVKDGYEVYLEGVYVVNGKKKRKVKKKKIAQVNDGLARPIADL